MDLARLSHPDSGSIGCLLTAGAGDHLFIIWVGGFGVIGADVVGWLVGGVVALVGGVVALAAMHCLLEVLIDFWCRCSLLGCYWSYGLVVLVLLPVIGANVVGWLVVHVASTLYVLIDYRYCRCSLTAGAHSRHSWILMDAASAVGCFAGSGNDGCCCYCFCCWLFCWFWE